MMVHLSSTNWLTRYVAWEARLNPGARRGKVAIFFYIVCLRFFFLSFLPPTRRSIAFERQAFLRDYAESYVSLHIDSVIQENYRAIKDDISRVLLSHGIEPVASATEGESPSERTAEKTREESERVEILPVDDAWED